MKIITAHIKKACAEKRIIMDNLVITVARGFGSCGKRIAKQIADDLEEEVIIIQQIIEALSKN